MNGLVSVIITTKNEESVIETLLQSIKRQSYKRFEIIVVDNSSTDKTKQIAKKYTKLVFNKGPERSAQRNFGVKKSKGKYVLVLDADMELSKSVLQQCVSVLNENQSVGALVIPEKSIGQGFWSRCKAFEREFYVGEESIEAARFFRKGIFEQFGGYDTSINGPEDWDLPLRMKKGGVKIGRISSFILHNERKVSLFRLARKKFYYGTHALGYLKRHPEMVTTQGNLLFRPVFFKKWKRLVCNPVMVAGMLAMRSIEMFAASLGIIVALLKRSEVGK